MRVAIVGGCGFIGHHLAGALRNSGRDVTVIDSLMINNLYSLMEENGWTERYRGFLQDRLDYLEGMGVPVLRQDARDYHVMSRALTAINPRIIFHLAAVAHIDRAKKEPHTTFDHSLHTLENTLDIARDLHVPVVYFSSSTAYGDFSRDIISEDEPLTPKGVYGGLKMAGETICRAYNQDYGLPVVIIRPQALYGPRCISGRVAQKFIEKALDGEDLEVHGTGGEKHDFTYIQDLVNAMTLVAGMEFKTGTIRTWNVTGEAATSLDQLAEIVSQRYDVGVIHRPKDDLKPKRGTMSCQAIRDELGYKPQWDIQRGMDTYMSWYDEALS